MAEPIIEIRDLYKAFGENRVYAGLSLDILRGEALAIVGGSGSGKSVLLRLLLGLEEPDAGTIRFEGQDLAALDETGLYAMRRRMAMLFQAGALFDSMTIADNVAYPLRLAGLEPEVVDARVPETLARVGLPDAGDKYPGALSGGMRKRAALARAIVTRPEVIFFDEPTAGLDPPNTRLIDELIASIHRDLRITIVMVTHDLPSAYLVADRIAMLAERRIVAVLPSAEFAVSEQPVIRAFAHAMAPAGGR